MSNRIQLDITVEQARSNVTSCKTCGRAIKKAQPRVVVAIPNGVYTKKAYHCSVCGANQLNKVLARLNDLTKQVLGNQESP
jgi:MinD superfamily P-loop ATPase